MPSPSGPSDSERPTPSSQRPTTGANEDAALVDDTELTPVVGVAASAGGLSAFKALLAHLTPDTGLAYVLIQHLDPNHKSMLVELLAKDCALPVSEIKDGMVIEPNHVYVIPPKHQIVVFKQFLHFSDEAAGIAHYHPADTFFQSLADDRRSQAIGVVLSGTASDGTKGCFAIKSAGGTTFAQDEGSAEYPGMPNSAVASGCIDFVLPPAQIAAALRRVVGHATFLLPALAWGNDVGLSITQDQMHKILSRLRSRTGNDFSSYKPATIQRRISKRMMVQRIDDPATYLKLLQRNSNEVDALFDDLLINVTGFFRDPKAFDELRKVFRTRFNEHRQPGLPVRVWVPGCSTGQEVYSIAMLIHELLGHLTGKQTVPVQIFGSDIDDDAVETARRGLYAEDHLEGLSPAQRTRYLHKVTSGYQVNKTLRDMCVFAVHNIVRDPPFSRLDLISCRNVMIYLNGSVQKRILRMFHYALQPGGYLMLGTSETIGDQADLFSTVSKSAKLYHKKTIAVRTALPELPMQSTAFVRPLAQEMDTERPFDLDAAAEKALLQHYAPPGVLVDANHSILRFYGRTWPYIEAAPGAASLSLFKNAHPDIIIELRAAVHVAMTTDESVRRDGVRLGVDGEQQRVGINVIWLGGPTRGEVYLLLMFEAQPELQVRPGADQLAAATDDDLVHQLHERNHELEHEVSSTRDYMQAIVEEQEGTNEELRSANEEIQSTNEELQSTNEELETAKEELQSANEELATVNEELETRNRETDLINSDLVNLLASVNIPIVILDANLQIRQFTQPARHLLNLIDADVGRRVDNIKPNIEVPNLQRLVTEVIDGMVEHAIELQDHEGRWYSVRLRPYRTIDRRVDGAIIAFIDITDVKAMRKTQHALDDERRLAMIVRDSNDAITLQDFDGNIEAWNPAAERIYGYTEAEAIGMNVLKMLPDAERKAMTTLYAAFGRGEESDPIEITRITKDGSLVRVRITPSVLIDDSGRPVGLVTTEKPNASV